MRCLPGAATTKVTRSQGPPWSPADAGLSGSGAGVRLTVARLQPLGRDVGVNLRGRGRGVPEDLLHAAQIGAALKQVGGRRVPDRVRPGVLHALGVDDAPRRPRVEAAPARPEEERGSAAPARQDGAAPFLPARYRPQRGDPDRDDALLAALAEHPDRAPIEVEAADVELAQLADANGGRVEQLKNGDVAQRQRGGDPRTGGKLALRPVFAFDQDL